MDFLHKLRDQFKENSKSDKAGKTESWVNPNPDSDSWVHKPIQNKTKECIQDELKMAMETSLKKDKGEDKGEEKIEKQKEEKKEDKKLEEKEESKIVKELSFFEKAKATVVHAREAMKEVVDTKLFNMKKKFADRVKLVKQRVEDNLWLRLENKIDVMLEQKIRPALFAKLLDDYMPDVLFNTSRRFLYIFWSDMRVEFWHAFYESKDNHLQKKLRKAKKEEQALLLKYSSAKLGDKETLNIVAPQLLQSARKFENTRMPESTTSFEQFQNFYLYHFSPYNKTLWESVHDIYWLIFHLLSVLPFGLLQIWSTLVFFLCMDRNDEFQLINFILRIKGTQFISLGVLDGLLAWFQYYRCATWNYSESVNSCLDSGPGNHVRFISEIIGLIIQLYLSWICFRCLPNSVIKGKLDDDLTIRREHGKDFRQTVVPKLSIGSLLRDASSEEEPIVDRSDDQHEITHKSDDSDSSSDDEKLEFGVEEQFNEDRIDSSKIDNLWNLINEKLRLHEFIEKYLPADFDLNIVGNSGRGGYLVSLLRYDLFVFTFIIVCAILFILFRPYSIIFGEPLKFRFLFFADISMLKTLYGVLAFPFLVFASPLKILLLHLRPTGYNKRGECVPMKIVKKYTDSYKYDKMKKSV